MNLKQKISQCFLFSLLLLLIGNKLLADGPPVDNQTGKVSMKSLVIILDSLQLVQVNRAWIFELKDEQLLQIQKYNKRFKTKILDVISFPYYDCTCGMFVYAIWNKENSVSLPIEFIKDYNNMLKDRKENDWGDHKYLKNRTFNDVIKRLSSHHIYIDFEGRTFIKNKKVTEKEIHRLIDKISKYNKLQKEYQDKKNIFFSTAPFINKKIKKIILGKIKRIKKYSNKMDVKCGDLVTRG
ncbi:MAG: hypothetical protein HW421_1216 [Ignavibacteria bacterium]|nr:hypothetical protein [Ignavibacteria bacterium]